MYFYAYESIVFISSYPLVEPLPQYKWQFLRKVFLLRYLCRCFLDIAAVGGLKAALGLKISEAYTAREIESYWFSGFFRK